MEHHYKHSIFYRNLIQKIPAKWEDIPVIPKNDWVGDYCLKPSSNLQKDIYVGSTSGSLGHPFAFGKDKFCHALTWSFVENCYKRVGISLNDLQARFYGFPYNWMGYSLRL